MATHHKVFLTERNVKSLLNKLDRVKAGEFSACNIIKCDYLHKKYPQTMEYCSIKAVETYDDLYKDGQKYTVNQIFVTREDLNKLTTVGSTLLIQLADDNGLTDDSLTVESVTDKEYYAEREPGFIVPADDPGVNK